MYAMTLLRTYTQHKLVFRMIREYYSIACYLRLFYLRDASQ